MLSEEKQTQFADLRRQIIDAEFGRMHPRKLEGVMTTEGPLLLLGGAGRGGGGRENVGMVKSQACQEAVEAGRNAALGHTRLVGFDLGNVMDSQGRRDQKHLKEARKVFSKMENKDPLINAYEKATGKKYELNNPINRSANKKETLEKQNETKQESSEKMLPNVQNDAKEQENEK